MALPHLNVQVGGTRLTTEALQIVKRRDRYDPMYRWQASGEDRLFRDRTAPDWARLSSEDEIAAEIETEVRDPGEQ